MTESKMTSADYPRGYWESAEGSNYVNYGDDPGWDVILRVLPKYAPTPAVIREVACAKGYFVQHAISAGYNARGIDISEYAISVAPGDVRPYVEQANAASVPWDDESADVVCSWEFFEHVYDDEIDTVLAEKLRVLRPGGLLVMKIGIVIPSDHPFAGQADHDKTHYAVHPREWWEEKFTAAGLWHVKAIEEDLDKAFSGRDWQGRFFAWRKPTDAAGG